MVPIQPAYNSFFTQRNPLLPKHLLGGVKGPQTYVYCSHVAQLYHMLPNEHHFFESSIARCLTFLNILKEFSKIYMERVPVKIKGLTNQ